MIYVYESGVVTYYMDVGLNISRCIMYEYAVESRCFDYLNISLAEGTGFMDPFYETDNSSLKRVTKGGKKTEKNYTS